MYAWQERRHMLEPERAPTQDGRGEQTVLLSLTVEARQLRLLSASRSSRLLFWIHLIGEGDWPAKGFSVHGGGVVVWWFVQILLLNRMTRIFYPSLRVRCGAPSISKLLCNSLEVAVLGTSNTYIR
jgi:hypothetical protein